MGGIRQRAAWACARIRGPGDDVILSKILNMAAKSPTAAEFRFACGQFATGVSVVTAERAPGKVHGMTANSVTSVSLNPLLLLVCVDHRAQLVADGAGEGAFWRQRFEAGAAGDFAVFRADRGRRSGGSEAGDSVSLDGIRDSVAGRCAGAYRLQRDIARMKREITRFLLGKLRRRKSSTASRWFISAVAYRKIEL